jgi:fructoselysine 6-kinase
MQLVGIGDNCVDCYVNTGMMYPGGNALNVAVFARRTGAEAGYVGVVGDDPPGRCISQALQAEDVDTQRLRVVAGPTAYATVDVVDGERVFGPNDLGVSIFTPTDDDHRYLAGFDLIHTGDCSGLEEHVGALAAHGRVSFDFGINREPAYLEPLLPHLLVAEFSASDLADDEVDDLVRLAHRQGPRFVLVTRGARGALLSDGRRAHRQPAVTTTVVDTLGAGDAFTAATLVGLASGKPLPEILHAAALLAARACAEEGAFGYGAPISAGIPITRPDPASATALPAQPTTRSTR